MGYCSSLSRMQGTSTYIEGKGQRNCVYYNHGACLINGECMGGHCGDYKYDNWLNRKRAFGSYNDGVFYKGKYK